jgi:hypothetical protein
VAIEDGGDARMVTVSSLGLGVLMGASVGLGFGYLGGVVVSAWGGVGLGLGWFGLRREAVWCGSPKRRKEEEKRNEEREKKS